MPSKNTIKTYVQDGFYHIYNRGVEKRNIFLDDEDYKVFLRLLKDCLTPSPDLKTLQKNFTLKGSTFKGVPRLPKNLSGQIELIAYCLMPNHFHLLVKQNTESGIKEFMQSIATRYSVYFNKKYKRVGPLFQSIYKAVLVIKEPYLLHLTRYIHLNPSEYASDIVSTYSSYGEYLGKRKTAWIKPEIILSFFDQSKLTFLKKVNSYKDFVENYLEDSKKFLGTLTLE